MSAEYAWFMLLFLRLCFVYVYTLYHIDRILSYIMLLQNLSCVYRFTVIYACAFLAHRMPRDCWAPAE